MTRLTLLILCSALVLLTACQKDTTTPVAQSTAQPPAQAAAQTTEPDTASPESAPAQTPPPSSEGNLKEKIEQLEETCGKLDGPVKDSCTSLVTALKASDDDAKTHVDAVIAGIKVEGNMVFLDEQTEKMLVEKYPAN